MDGCSYILQLKTSDTKQTIRLISNPMNQLEFENKLLIEANTAYVSGNYVVAEEKYKNTLEISPYNLEALLKLSQMYTNEGFPSLAIPLLLHAMGLQPSNPYIYYNIGLAYQRTDELHLAIHYYKKTLSMQPDFPLASNNLGVTLQHLGYIQQANQYFSQAFSQDTNCFEAYYNYSQSHQFTEEDKELLNSLEEKVTDNSIENDKKVIVCFTLGKAYDDLRDYQRAFQFYHMGNNLKEHNFNIENFNRYIDKIIKVFSQNSFTKIKETPKKKPKFIFIVGMPRSGSTLVEQIILTNPNVHSGGEIGFIGNIVDDISDFLNTTLPYPDCMLNISKAELDIMRDQIYSVTEEQCPSSEYIIDKSPINFLHIGLIKLLFPNAIVIHTKRNAMDTCLSCYFQNFQSQHQYTYSLTTLGRFYLSYVRLMNHWRAQITDNFIEVDYEELVLNYKQTINLLLKKCGLGSVENNKSFYESNSIVRSASKWQTRQPIYHTSVNRHKHYLPYIEELINALTRD